MDPQERIDVLVATCAAVEGARAALKGSNHGQIDVTECIGGIRGEMSYWASHLQGPASPGVAVRQWRDNPAEGTSSFHVDPEMFATAGCAAKTNCIFAIFFATCLVQFVFFFTFSPTAGVQSNALWDACKLVAAHISHSRQLWPVKLVVFVALVAVLWLIGNLMSVKGKCGLASPVSSPSCNFCNSSSSSNTFNLSNNSTCPNQNTKHQIRTTSS